MPIFSSSRPKVRGRVVVKFPAQLMGTNGLTMTKTNGIWTVQPDFAALAPLLSITPADRANVFAHVWESSTNTYARASMDVLLSMISAGLDPTLVTIGGLAPVADQGIYFTGPDVAAVFTLTEGGRALVGLTPAADKLGYWTASNTAALADFTAFARTLLANASALDARTDLGLVIGADVQAQDATLQSLSSLGSGADRIAYTTAVDTWAETTLTTFGRSLIDDPDAASARGTLGLPAATVDNTVPRFHGVTGQMQPSLLAVNDDGGTTAPYFIGQAVQSTGETYTGTFHQLAEIASPANPPANSLRVFAKDVGGIAQLFHRDSSGAEKDLTNTQPLNARLTDIAGVSWAQGDILYFNGANLARLTPGTSGHFLKTQGAGANPTWTAVPGGGDLLSTNNLSDVASRPTAFANILDASWFRGHIFGLTLSNNAANINHDIDIASGLATADDGSTIIKLTSSLTKRLGAAWAVGSENGGLDTGAVTDGTYHVWLIRRPDTGVVDALLSASATSPTMPANYSQKRRIGSIVRASGMNHRFSQMGDQFLYTYFAPQDVAAMNPGTSPVTRSLSVPKGIKVTAILHVTVNGGPEGRTRILSPEQSDQAGLTNTGGTDTASNGTVSIASQFHVRTNTLGQVVSVHHSAQASHLAIWTAGWIDSRGRDA